jgi:hypothetical protein
MWAKIRPVSYWYFLAAFAVSGVVCVSALRHNNLTMVRLRDQVAQADKDDGDVETALRNLREYVYAHMNTNLATGNQVKPPIQLKYRYERLLKAEQDKAAVSSSQIYTQAQATCERLYPQSFSGGSRVPCIQDYVTSHGVQAKTIPDALYKFDFVSPLWSPDLAGWSMVLSAVFLALFIIRYGMERWMRLELKHHA